MWKSQVGGKLVPPPNLQNDDDDWETDPNFVNDLNEKESRWGAKTVEGSGHQDSVFLDQLRSEVLESDALNKKNALADQSKASDGYGGKFGVHTDRIDKCAEKYDYQAKKELHASQKDYSQGFGGQFGVQTDRQDKSALGWSEREKLQQHESQTDYKKGFGGQFGVQTDRQDKSALGWNEREKLQQHESQTDYKKGFGGQFGVQTDRKDKSAVGWEERENLHQHESQADYKKGFGGQFGIQKESVDQNAHGWNERSNLEKHESQKPAEVAINKGNASTLRSKFEQMTMQQNQDKVLEERERRRREDEELRKKQAESEQFRQQKIDAEWEQRKSNDVEPEKDNSSPFKAVNPAIGVCLPRSTATNGTAPCKPSRTSEFIKNSQQLEDSTIPSAPVANIQSVPACSLPAVATNLINRRNSSTTEEENNDAEWEDETNQQEFTLQAPCADRNTSSSTKAAITNTQNSESCRYEIPPSEEELTSATNHSNVDQNYVATNTTENSNNNLTAIALYDYEKQDDDEIGFEVNDIITDIEQVDVGWWRGMCKGSFGLFPANYVQLRQ